MSAGLTPTPYVPFVYSSTQTVLKQKKFAFNLILNFIKTVNFNSNFHYSHHLLMIFCTRPVEQKQRDCNDGTNARNDKNEAKTKVSDVIQYSSKVCSPDHVQPHTFAKDWMVHFWVKLWTEQVSGNNLPPQLSNPTGREREPSQRRPQCRGARMHRKLSLSVP